LNHLAALTPLRHPSFRLLFAGQLVSDLGDWLDFLALVVLIVYQWNLGAVALAALSVAMFLPRALVAPVAGVWADRWSRKWLMVGCDLIRAAIVLSLVWAGELWIVLGLVFAKGAFSGIFFPARQATLAASVPAGDLLAANALSQLSTQVTKVVGPALGGLLVATAGPRSAFAVDAISFAISASFLVRLPDFATLPPPTTAEPSRFLASLRDGVAHVLRVGLLRAAILGNTAALLVVFAYDSLFPLAVRDLGVNEALLGGLLGSIGLGTTMGALAVGQWGSRKPALLIMGAGQIGVGALVAALGAAVQNQVTAPPVFLLFFVLLMGVGAAAMFVPYMYAVQSETPPNLMGRVMGAAHSLETAVQLLAPPIGAAIAQVWGVGFLFAASGASLVAIGLSLIAANSRTHSGLDKPRGEPNPSGATPRPGTLRGSP
jgi:MFS family permease